MVAPKALSHLMWGAPDMDAACSQFHDLTGVMPAAGGVHPGLGTRNALARLGTGVHIEILAPDPDQSPDDSAMARRLADLAAPALLSYYCAANNLGRIIRALRDHKIEAEGPVALSRRRADDDVMLKWSLLWPMDPAFGACLPVFVDWADTGHPSIGAPGGATLTDFEVGHPDAARLATVMSELGVEIRPVAADRAYLRARLETARGPVTLVASA